MLTANRTQSRAHWSRTFHLLAGCVLLAGIGNGQTDQTQPYKPGPVDKASVSKAISRLKAGEISAFDMNLLDQAGAVETIPVLEEQFARSDDSLDKAKIAQVLIHLGAKNDTYWTYLVEQVTPALDGVPYPFTFDSQGKQMSAISGEFKTWAEAHYKTSVQALEDALYILPGKVGLLALTGDPRAVPILRQALASPNYLIEAAGAEGLAAMKDKAAIPLIIDAAGRAPAEPASTISSPLVYFDDPQAQNAFDKNVPKERAQILRDAKEKGKTPLR